MDKFFGQLLALVQNGASFIQGQLPDYVNQLLAFKFWSYVTYIALWLLAVAICAFALLFVLRHIAKSKKEYVKYNPEDDMLVVIPSVVAGIGLAILLIIGGLVGPDVVTELIEIKVAPKVFVVDYLRDVLRSR